MQALTTTPTVVPVKLAPYPDTGTGTQRRGVAGWRPPNPDTSPSRESRSPRYPLPMQALTTTAMQPTAIGARVFTTASPSSTVTVVAQPDGDGEGATGSKKVKYLTQSWNATHSLQNQGETTSAAATGKIRTNPNEWRALRAQHLTHGRPRYRRSRESGNPGQGCRGVASPQCARTPRRPSWVGACPALDAGSLPQSLPRTPIRGREPRAGVKRGGATPTLPSARPGQQPPPPVLYLQGAQLAAGRIRGYPRNGDPRGYPCAASPATMAPPPDRSESHA